MNSAAPVLFDAYQRQAEWVATLSCSDPVTCGVVHPCDRESLRGAIEAHAKGLIIARLIGPQGKIQQAAVTAGLDLAGIAIDDVPHSHAAADRAAQLAAAGRVEILMKGSLHTDELMRSVLALPQLRTKRRASHVFRFDIPTYPKPVLLTDAAINIAPTLEEKVDIVANAIGLAHVLGIARPKVAILSAVETVTPMIASTVDAAAICKMADRGQIEGALIDGPLAFDNAISAESARVKGIVSQVAGDADILVVPDLESGNMLAKLLEHLAGAASCGVVLGARIPIALTSRSDGASSRFASAGLAGLLARAWRSNRP